MPDPRAISSAIDIAHAATTRAHSGALIARWRERLTIVSLRGDPGDPAFRESVQAALGVELPLAPNCTTRGPALRVVWVGPDDWFVIAPSGEAGALFDALRRALAGQHAALTDVSSGYAVLRLEGPPVRDVLAQGCPLDLHPRAFGPDRCAGSHFFKASIWLWQTDAGPTFELLVRRSFMGYVGLMLERITRECGLDVRSDRASWNSTTSAP
jgi:sarcosine oxidase subunit gamma